MPKHEFGIMKNKPMNKDRFDEYEPNKYNCIEVDDDFTSNQFFNRFTKYRLLLAYA